MLHLHACKYPVHEFLTPMKARRGSQMWKPELQTVVSCHEDAGNITWVLIKSNKHS